MHPPRQCRLGIVERLRPTDGLPTRPPGIPRWIQTHDLFVPNETTWAFDAIAAVGCTGELQVTALEQLAGEGYRRNYCGLTADWTVDELVGGIDGSSCSDHPTAVRRTQ